MRLCYSSAAKWFVTPDWSNCFEMGYIIYNYRALGGAAGLRFHLPQVHPHVEITLILGHFKEGPLALPRIQAPSLPCEPKGTRKPRPEQTERSRRGRGGPGRGAGSPPRRPRGDIPLPTRSPHWGSALVQVGSAVAEEFARRRTYFLQAAFFSFFLGFALKKGT